MSTAILPPVPPAPAAPAAPVATASGRPERRVAETGVWIGIATISMSFAALTSALVVRQASAPGSDWQHFQLPSLLYVNTLVLLLSSVTLDVTLALGLLFLVGQAFAWRQLAAQNLHLATGPSSAFFYVLTVLHAMHVLGGLVGLGYVERRLAAGVLSRTTFRAAALYWHFMAVLWLYLLALLTLRG